MLASVLTAKRHQGCSLLCEAGIDECQDLFTSWYQHLLRRISGVLLAFFFHLFLDLTEELTTLSEVCLL